MGESGGKSKLKGLTGAQCGNAQIFALGYTSGFGEPASRHVSLIWVRISRPVQFSEQDTDNLRALTRYRHWEGVSNFSNDDKRPEFCGN